MTIATPVDEYLAEVRAALADLPPAEVEAICQDLGPQFAEVAAELGPGISLAGRLGSPSQYAAELRAAAGYAPATGRVTRVVGSLLLVCAVFCALSGLLGGFNSVRNGFDVQLANVSAVVILLLPMLIVAVPLVRDTVPEYRIPARIRDYFESLRPGWRLLRAVILVSGAVFAMSYYPATPEFTVLPMIMLGILLGFGRDPRWAGLTVPANAFAAGMGLSMMLTLWSLTL